MNIEIKRQNKDGLERELWRFVTLSREETTLYLDFYSVQTRQTKRHEWKVVKSKVYDRLMSRNNTLDLQSDVPLPNDVATEARQEYIDSIIIKKWDI